MQKTITQRKSIRTIVANSFVQIGYPIYALMRIRRKPWTFTVDDYLKFPESTLGNDIGKFLKLNEFSPLARAEFHDVYHILFQLDTTMKDETTIQFIVMGNGKLSVPNILSSLVAIVFYPEYWETYKHAWHRGKNARQFHHMNFEIMLNRNTEELRKELNL